LVQSSYPITVSGKTYPYQIIMCEQTIKLYYKGIVTDLIIFNISHGIGVKQAAVVSYDTILNCPGEYLNFSHIFFLSLTNNKQIKMTISTLLTFNHTTDSYDYNKHGIIS